MDGASRVAGMVSHLAQCAVAAMSLAHAPVGSHFLSLAQHRLMVLPGHMDFACVLLTPRPPLKIRLTHTHTHENTHTHAPVLGPLTHAGGQRRRWLPRAPPHGLVLPLLHQQQRGARRCAWARHQTPWDITLVPSCAHPPHLRQQQRGARRRMRPLQAPAPLPPSLPAAATAHCCASRAIGSPCLPPLRLSRSPCTRVLLLPGGRVVVAPPRPHL